MRCPVVRMLRQPERLHDPDVMYDALTSDTDPFEPSPMVRAPCNPHFSALRYDSMALTGPPAKSKFLAVEAFAKGLGD